MLNLEQMTSVLEGFSFLNEDFLAIMSVSLDSSCARWYSSDFLSDW